MLFSDLKNKILKAVNEKKTLLGITEELLLVDGFVTHSVHKEFTGNIVIGGPVLPTITAVGKNSGMAYSFALKALLPELEV